MYYLLISPFESASGTWTLQGPFETLEGADLVRRMADYTKENYIISPEDMAAMCRLFWDEDGEFLPPALTPP